MANDVKLGYGACQNPKLCALLRLPIQEKLPLLPKLMFIAQYTNTLLVILLSEMSIKRNTPQQ